MEGSQILPRWELGRQETKSRKRLQGEIRRSLVKGAGDSRPRLMWRCVRWLRREHKKETAELREQAKQRAQANLETIFAYLAWASWLAVVLVWGVDVAFSGSERSVIYDSMTAGIAVAALGLVLLVTTMVDIASYRPRLFAQCLGPADEFFESLAELSPDLDDHVDRIAHEQPETWQRAKKLEQGLLVESTRFIVPDGVRSRIIRRVFQRLVGLIASLALLGYGLSAATGGGLLRACPNVKQCGAGQSAMTLPEHLFFSVVSFFNGFSDLQLVHDVAGYAYLVVIVISVVAVVYFFLTDVVASQGEFRANMRAAAESYVLQNSKL
jgi:hypothetical protein